MSFPGGVNFSVQGLICCKFKAGENSAAAPPAESITSGGLPFPFPR